MSDFSAKKLLKKVWARADVDGGGTLDKEELKVVMQQMGRKDPDMDAVMADLDADGSGDVDRKEFEVWFFKQDDSTMQIMGAIANADEAFEKAASAHGGTQDPQRGEGAAASPQAVRATQAKAAAATKKHLEQAIAEYSRAIEMGAPEQDEVLGARAECLASTGKPGDLQKGVCVTAAGSALDDANQAVELNEDYEGWHILKGSILYAMGKAEEAEESYNRAAELNDAVSTRDEGTEASKKEIEASLKRMEEFPWTMPER